jgi:glycosyltransferase involved in cell wall biosynthesis
MPKKPIRDRPRLLILNQYYWPGPEASGHLLTELCESLRADYEVHVITAAVQGDDQRAARLIRNGVTIDRVPSTSFDRAHIPGRAANYLTFMGAALVRGLQAGEADVVLCMTDPPMLGAAAVFLARRHRTPLIVVCEDVFPEIASALGRLRNPLVIGALRRTVSFYLRRADRVVAIGETMRARLEVKGAPPERIRVIPNWVDVSLLEPRAKENDWALENGLAGKFVVMHSGNVGHAQDLDALVRAAERLRDLDDLEVLIVGSGARRTEMMRLAERLGLDNVRFLPYQPRERLSESLSSADVHVVGLAPGLAGYVVPSRLYGILAVGRPVIAAVDAESETAHVVEAANCGVRVPPASPDLLAAAIRRCHTARGELAELGRNGREYVEREGDRSVAIERYRALITEVLDESSREGVIKILRVIARLNVGGPTLHVAYLTKGLAPLGYETTLATGRIGSNEGSMDYIASEVGVQPLYIGWLQRNLSLFADFAALLRLVGLIRSQRPDVLHTHTAKAGALGRAAALLSGHARPEVVVHTYHGHVLTGYFSPLMSKVFLGVERFLAHSTDALVAVSPEVRDDLVGLGVAPASKFVVVRLGLDLEQRIAAPENARELLRDELSVEPHQFLIVWLGRMTEIKRVDDLLRAFADVRGRGVDAVLALVGDGPNRGGLEQLAEQLGIRDAVRFTGFRRDVGSIYRASDVVALSSANEGTPVSLIEALAAGCAVVTTDVGGAVDVLDGGRVGFLVPAGDTKAFADRLEDLVRQPELRHEFGAAGREHVLARYSVDRLVHDIDRLYRRLLGAKASRLPEAESAT